MSDLCYQNVWDEETGETVSIPLVGDSWRVYADPGVHWYWTTEQQTRE